MEDPEFTPIVLKRSDIGDVASFITRNLDTYPFPGKYIKDPESRYNISRSLWKAEIERLFEDGNLLASDTDFNCIGMYSTIGGLRSDSMDFGDYVDPLKEMASGDRRRAHKALSGIGKGIDSLKLPPGTMDIYVVCSSSSVDEIAYCSCMVQHLIGIADSKGTDLFVCTVMKAMVRLYEANGFKTLKVLDDQENDIKSWYMIHKCTVKE